MRVRRLCARTCQSKAAASATNTEAALFLDTNGLCSVAALTAIRTAAVTSQNLTPSARSNGSCCSVLKGRKLPACLMTGTLHACSAHDHRASSLTRLHRHAGAGLSCIKMACHAHGSSGRGSARTLEPSVTERQHQETCAGAITKMRAPATTLPSHQSGTDTLARGQSVPTACGACRSANAPHCPRRHSR